MGTGNVNYQSTDNQFRMNQFVNTQLLTLTPERINMYTKLSLTRILPKQ